MKNLLSHGIHSQEKEFATIKELKTFSHFLGQREHHLVQIRYRLGIAYFEIVYLI